EVTSDLYEAKNALGSEMRDKIEFLDIRKTPVSLSFSAKLGQPFTVTVNTSKENFTVQSKSLLIAASEKAIDQELIEKRFKTVKSAVHTLESYNFDNLDAGLIVPLKEVSNLKDEIDFILNGSVEVI
ncbi:DUF3656 domain-containing protein, partial [Vibrio sp. 10N.222.49.E5]